MASPTTRTLALYRERGYVVAVVERWNQHANIRQDAFGFADLIAYDGRETIAIQATSTSNLATRVSKIMENDNARRWAEGPHRRIVAIGWRKYKRPVDRKWWRCVERVIEDFKPA